MTQQEQKDRAFQSIFFALDSVQYIRHKSGERFVSQASSCYSIVAVTAGLGSFRIDGTSIQTAKGKCLFLLPGTKLEGDSDEESELSYYVIQFNIISIKELDFHLLSKGEIKAEPFDRYADIWRRIYEEQHSENEKEQFKNQFRFQKLMYGIIEQNYLFDQARDSAKSVKDTIAYLDEHYKEEVTTEQLAALAHLGIKQYVFLFKKLTGQNPIEYITELRMRKAKQLLILSANVPLKDIAEQVGYQDPYYFNRRFKQVVGIPPRQYIKTRKFRVISADYACPMLALGLKPIGALAYQIGFYAKGQAGAIDNIGHKNTFYFDKMASLRPDLLVVGDEIEPEVAAKLQRIAPIARIPWMGLNATGHLRAVADLLGMTKEAEQWIETYEYQREEAKHKLKPYLDPNETVVILLVENQDLFILGDRNAGEILYSTLGIKPPHLVRRELEVHPNQYGKRISLESLPDFEADRMLIIIYGNEAQQTFNRIQNEEIWRNLRAVQRSNVQVLDSEKWIYYDVLSLQGQLDDAVRLFSSTC